MKRARFVALALWAGVIFCLSPAIAQEPQRGLVFDCMRLAEGIREAAIYRDLGADLAKTIAYYRANAASTPEPRKAVVEREIRRVWREGLLPNEAAYAIWRRCQAQLGDMGREA